ncbi:SRA-YDG domain-containing protein [Corchorus capsularis]|uniref:SRA-YDG domain-containing protein n=1 Tax=Corchorus capsularis TaxID=210143 RepID=A0A1R3J0H9_COCAP|nr:SRA-YDG domain-containing protein [Corchorus capsularis]
MDSVRPKLGNNGSFLKPKLESQAGKRVVHNGVDFKRVVFNEEWYANRRKIKEALSFYRRLLVDRELFAKLEKETNLDGEKKSGVATSIVNSGRYDNVEGITPNTFTYCGEGENPNFGRKPKDQKLAGGNLALKNSSVSKMPVKVIRKVNTFDDSISKQHSDSMAAASEGNDCGYKYVYYGLYKVTKYWSERKGHSGTIVYKFSLKKVDEKEPEHEFGGNETEQGMVML